MLLVLMAGFSDSVSLLVLPFWEIDMFKIHLKKGKIILQVQIFCIKNGKWSRGD